MLLLKFRSQLLRTNLPGVIVLASWLEQPNPCLGWEFPYGLYHIQQRKDKKFRGAPPLLSQWKTGEVPLPAWQWQCLCPVSAEVHRSPGAGGRGHAAQLDGACGDHIRHSRRHHPVCEADLRGDAGGERAPCVSLLTQEMLKHIINNCQLPWVPLGCCLPFLCQGFAEALLNLAFPGVWEPLAARFSSQRLSWHCWTTTRSSSELQSLWKKHIFYSDVE